MISVKENYYYTQNIDHIFKNQIKFILNLQIMMFFFT